MLLKTLQHTAFVWAVRMLLPCLHHINLSKTLSSFSTWSSKPTEDFGITTPFTHHHLIPTHQHSLLHPTRLNLLHGCLPQLHFTPSNLPRSAQHILDCMDRLDCQMSFATYASLLDLYGRGKALSDGNCVHQHILKHGLERDELLGKLLLEMYCRCGAMEDALELFSKLFSRATSSWNFLMKTFTQQGNAKEALQLFEQMQEEAVMPSKVTYVTVVSASATLATLDEGVRLHAHIAGTSLESDVVLGTALINMYGKCDSTAYSKGLFDQMAERNVCTWTTMIGSYVQHDEGKEALQLFDRMKQGGEMPNKVTFIIVLSACATLAGLAEGKRIHVCIQSSGCQSDLIVGTALVNMYGKFGCLKDAQDVLRQMAELNVVSWNAMIAACAKHGHSKEAFEHFHEMQESGVLPDNITFVNIADVCNNIAAFIEGKQIHARIVECEIESDISLGNALVSMYGKCGRIRDAEVLFENMGEKDVVSWNAMIAVYTQHGHGKKALKLFDQMLCEGVMPNKVTFTSYLDACANLTALAQGEQMHACIVGNEMDSDVFVGTAVVYMYGKCGSLEYAQRMFDKMPTHDVITWNALIAAYAQHGQGKEALLLFDQMTLKGMAMSMATFVSVLDACAGLANLAEGERRHSHIIICGYDSNVTVENALINMYGKCGSLVSAWMTFKEMRECDAVSWSSMIGIHAQHGQGEKALCLFAQMLENAVPDEITFLNVLGACNHTGLVDEAHYWFTMMGRDHGIVPNVDHYNGMIDVLGRAGRLDEAETLAKKVPFQQTFVAWMGLLGACRYNVDVTRAEFAAEHAFELEPENHMPYVMLSNIYAAAGRGEDAAKLMHVMRHKGVKELPKAAAGLS